MSPNLDLSLTLYPRSNPSDKTFNNPINVFVSTDSARGLSATISKRLLTAVEYIIEVDGAAIQSGAGPATDYGSLGIYKLTIVRGRATDSNLSSTISDLNAASSLANKLILPVGSTTIGGAQKGYLPTDLVDDPPLISRYTNRAFAI